MKKVLIVIIVLVVLVIGGYFVKEYITAYNLEIDEYNRLLHIENNAKALFSTIENKTIWSADIEEIESDLDKLLELYPNTNTASKAKKFKEELPSRIQDLIIIHNRELEVKRIEEEKLIAERDKWTMYLKKIGKGSMDKDYSWYKRFTEEEKNRLYQGEVIIGDRDIMILFLEGFYEKTTSESSYGKSNQYLGNERTAYSYITSHEGIIDYISY